MNLIYVETFYWAASLKSVSDAAKRMHIVPQAAAARIRALEAELGVMLRDRRARAFRLTSAGERFMVDAERLLGLWREIRPTYRSQLQAPASLHIGTLESVLHAWLIPWMEDVRKQHPSLSFQWTTETSAALSELVVRGSLDLIVATEPASDDGVKTHPLPSLPMAFVGYYPLHRQPSYSLAELANYELLTFQRGSDPYVKLLELLAAHELEETQVHAISSVSAMLRLVSAGIGVAVLPQAALDATLLEQGFVHLNCDVSLAPLPLSVSWRADPASEVLDTIAQGMIAHATKAAAVPPHLELIASEADPPKVAGELP